MGGDGRINMSLRNRIVNFNPHLRMGGDLSAYAKEFNLDIFQSTPPYGR